MFFNLPILTVNFMLFSLLSVIYFLNLIHFRTIAIPVVQVIFNVGLTSLVM